MSFTNLAPFLLLVSMFYNFFFVAHTQDKEARLFVSNKLFRPSLIFVFKILGLYWKAFYGSIQFLFSFITQAPGQRRCLKYDLGIAPTMDSTNSQFDRNRHYLNYDRKKIYSTGPRNASHPLNIWLGCADLSRSNDQAYSRPESRWRRQKCFCRQAYFNAATVFQLRRRGHNLRRLQSNVRWEKYYSGKLSSLFYVTTWAKSMFSTISVYSWNSWL